MSGSAPLKPELMKALLSAHRTAKDDDDYLTKVSLAFRGFFDFNQDQVKKEEKRNITLASLPLLPLEIIASYLDFESLVSQSCFEMKML